jgi:ketosteroid isomerase-like protein
MSDENVEIVRRNLGDFAVTGKLAPEVAEDFVWDMSTFRGWPDQPLYRGSDAFYEFLAAWQEPYEDWSFEVDDVLDGGGDDVVALVTQRGRPHGGDMDVHLEFGLIYTLQDGLIRHIHVYAAKVDALEAAGLAA